MFVNWGVEARKWQLALRPVTDISLITSFKAVFSGNTFAFFTPNRMGEYFGRVMHIEEGKRLSSIALTIVCSIAQLLITITAGAAGLFFLKEVIANRYTGVPNIIFWLNIMIAGLIVCAIVLTLFYFRFSWMLRWAEKIRGIRKFLTYIQVLHEFNATILLRILSLSLTRYMVFIVQYYLLFKVFGVEIDWWQTFWTISVVFVVIAIVPSLAVLTELGVRWKASIEVVQLFSANGTGILATSLAAWIINLVIPALIGSLLLLGLKIFRK
jgi:MFS family permease